MAKKRIRGLFTYRIKHELYFLGKVIWDNTRVVSPSGYMSNLSLASKWSVFAKVLLPLHDVVMRFYHMKKKG